MTQATDFPFLDDPLCMDVLDLLGLLPDQFLQMDVSSPGYWAQKRRGKHGARDYGVPGQWFQEETREAYLERQVALFGDKDAGWECLWRVLRDDGTVWWNIGDCHIKKQLQFIPARLAIMLQDRGWVVRDMIVWDKPNPRTQRMDDAPLASWEPILLISKQERYFYDEFAGKEPLAQPNAKSKNATNKHEGYGSNIYNGYAYDAADYTAGRVRRNVWHMATARSRLPHFAAFPPALPELCIKIGSSDAGACPACGAPLARVVDRISIETRPGTNSKIGELTREVTGLRDAKRHVTLAKSLGFQPTCTCLPQEIATVEAWMRRCGADSNLEYNGQAVKDYASAGAVDASDLKRKILKSMHAVKHTAGWVPSCDCEVPATVPCVVADIFGGTGTTFLKAIELGRRCITGDLNPLFVDLMRMQAIDYAGRLQQWRYNEKLKQAAYERRLARWEAKEARRLACEDPALQRRITDFVQA